MPADFDHLRRELENLGADTRQVSLAGPDAARRRARHRARNQAIAVVVGAVAIVAGGVFAFAQPTLRSAPDFANSPADTSSPSTAPTPSPTDLPPLPTSVLVQAGDLDPAAGWAETDPAQVWPCAPQPPGGELVLRRSFAYQQGDGRIDQIVEATRTLDIARVRLAQIRADVESCVRADSGFDLDQIWDVTGVGDETVLIRYWAPPRQGESRLIVGISLVRSGNAVTSVAHGGFAMDANEPDTTDLAEAAVGRLCAATGGACVTEVARGQTFPVPAGDLPGWLVIADVSGVPGLDRLTGASEVLAVDDGSFGFVCFESNSADAGATSVQSRVYSDPLDPAGDLVEERVATFPSARAATAHYQTLVAEGACAAEPTLSVENLGTVGGPASGFAGTAWRSTAPATGAAFGYGVVVSGSAVAFVNLNVVAPEAEQIRTLLTLAGERLPESGQPG